MTGKISVFIRMLCSVCFIVGSSVSSAQFTNIERNALIDFYEKANGERWKNNDGWGGRTFPCNWYGITCDFDGISIFLSGNNLTGTVSQDLGFMERLKRLDLSRNELEGQIPDSLGRLEQLQYLDLSQNKLSGPIPDAIGSITELRHFNIQHNDQISGEFPKSICELSNIQVLKLGNTTLTGQSNLSGEIPACITNLKSLTHLDISSTKLSGEIPLEMGSLVELHTLEMYGNEGLVGSIPQSFGKLRNLRTLALSNNNLSGNIPTALGNLENLRRIVLEENALTGSVPASFENFSGLELLSLRNNALTGKMPSFPFRWETPLGLFLGGNKFDVVDSLENLNREYEEGLLTDEEFQEAKRQLLL